MRTDKQGNVGLYVHVPFCRQKCAYCDFYSLPIGDLYHSYTNALCTHLRAEAQRTRKFCVDTVFFGGGTPSALPSECLYQIFDTLNTHYSILPDAEWTMEANPATVQKDTLSALKTMGLNRLSIGVQSTNEQELKALGRLHTATQAKEAVELAHRVGISNVSADLMYAIPYQTEKSLQQSIAQVADWGVAHLSLYALHIEENTPFAKRKDALPLPGEDAEVRMYLDAIAQLEQLGLAQYEISNFAKDGYACRHNLKYWQMKPYLAFGPAAHGFLENRRYSIPPDLQAYIEVAQRQDFGSLVQTEEVLTPRNRQSEWVMLRLRLCEGISDAAFAAEFGTPFSVAYADKIPFLLKNGVLCREKDRYFFSVQGFCVSNAILADLLEFD